MCDARPGNVRRATGCAAPIWPSRGHTGPRLRRAGWRRNGDDAPGREVRAAPTGPTALIRDPRELDARARASASPPHSSASSMRRSCGRCRTRIRSSSSRSMSRKRGKDKPSRYAPSMGDIRTWRTLTAIVSNAGMGRVSGFVPLIVDTGTRAAPHRRRSVRRLSRDLRHPAHPWSRHSGGRHARRRPGGRAPRPRLLATRIRR